MMTKPLPPRSLVATSKNLHRRQLTDTQRAMIGAEVANLVRGQHAPTTHKEISQPPKVSTKQAAAMLNVKPSAVTEARDVKRKCPPEVVEAVKQGKVVWNPVSPEVLKVKWL